MTPRPAKPRLTDVRAHQLVASERDRIEAAIADVGAGIRAEGSGSSEQAGETRELGTDVAREGVDMAMLVSLEHQLEAADRAVARIQAGTFGLSVDSGGRIPSDRLEAAPLAERTVEEQRAFERGD
jgi:DnaK suppressor protein